MKTFCGFVIAVHLKSHEILLFGPHPDKRGIAELLVTNKFMLFPVRTTAEKIARQLAKEYGGASVKVVVGAAEICIARSLAECEPLRKLDNLFAVMIGSGKYSPVERIFFGPRVSTLGAFDGRQEARYNGLMPFQNFTDVEYAAGEISRQCACAATVARAVFSWF